MIAAMLVLTIAAAAPIPPGVPYADSPVSRADLRGLEAHAWGYRKYGSVAHIQADGRGRFAFYFRVGPGHTLLWGWMQEFYTQHRGTIVVTTTSSVPLTDPSEIDEPGADDACFGVSSIRWTARYLYSRDIDMAATRRANPWLHRQPGGPHCADGDIDLGHLSPADQARLELRWGKERRIPVAPNTPDIRLPDRVQGIEGPTGKPIPPDQR